MTKPTTTDSGIDLDQQEAYTRQHYATVHDCEEFEPVVLALIEGLRVAEEDLRQLTLWADGQIEGQQLLLERLRTAERRLELADEDVATGRRVIRNMINATRELEAKLAAAEFDHDKTRIVLTGHYRAVQDRNVLLEEQVRLLTAERDLARERLEGRVDIRDYEAERSRRRTSEESWELERRKNAQLQEQVERLTAEHEKDRQAWMAENTELLTQVERLTAELADMSHTDYLGRTRLDITNDSLAVRKLNGELRKQVERLIAELEVHNTKK